MERARQLLAIALAGAATVFAACGGSDEPEGKGLPAATVSELERRLDEIERRYREAVDNGNVGACDDIQNDSIPAVNEIVGGLPDDVDPDVRQAVEESFTRLEELTQSDCSSVEPEETETETTPTTPETIPEPVPETETEPETKPEKAPKEPKPEKPPKGEDDGGGGGAAPVDPTAPGQGGGAVPGADG